MPPTRGEIPVSLAVALAPCRLGVEGTLSPHPLSKSVIHCRAIKDEAGATATASETLSVVIINSAIRGRDLGGSRGR